MRWTPISVLIFLGCLVITMFALQFVDWGSATEAIIVFGVGLITRAILGQTLGNRTNTEPDG